MTAGEPDITVVMITVDRSPKQNYLRQTIENLSRGRVFTSERLRSFTLFVGQPVKQSDAMSVDRPLSPYETLIADLSPLFHAIADDYRLLPCENAGRALTIGAELTPANGWMLFLEDDIDVCDDFLGSVGRWLDLYAPKNDDEYAIYQFGCPYIPAERSNTSDVWWFSDRWVYPSNSGF